MGLTNYNIFLENGNRDYNKQNYYFLINFEGKNYLCMGANSMIIHEDV